MKFADLSKQVAISLVVSLLTALLISLLFLVSGSIRAGLVQWLDIHREVEKALAGQPTRGDQRLAADMLFGIHGSTAGTTVRTFSSANLLVDANSSNEDGITGRDQIDWYDASGNSDVRLNPQDRFAVWVLSSALGKKNYESQNHLTEARFLGTFKAGEQHNAVTLGTDFGHGAIYGRMTALFIAVRVRE
ncbi:MAG: hypothetical protein OXQ29_15895 [Rhodospirillaceae bacterium]|nr:hypothetical protein [Rhodospirillaceae bacterium]